MESLTQTQWKPISPSTGTGPAFERPLGITEEGFYWDSVFDRTADTLRHAEVVVRGDSVEAVLSVPNLNKAWAVLKQRYPLLQAIIEERSQDEVVFIVDPSRSAPDNQTDLFIEEVHALEVDLKVESLLNGQSPLSNTLLACVFVLKRSDKPSHAHILIHSAHSISDGVAHDTLLRELLQLLSDSDVIPKHAWTERLVLSVATESLPPYQDSTPPKARWRRAIGQTIIENRRARMAGGQTLPRTVTSRTAYRPAQSRSVSLSFSVQETQQILQTCRKHQLKFGNVLPMIGQLAIGGVLCSHFLQGKMNEAEWEFRKTEPMVNAGPLNLRPHINSDWYRSGGAGNASLSIGFYFYQLPVAPLAPASGISPGAPMPPYLDIMEKTHFFHRCRAMKKRVMDYIHHPLFFYMNTAYLQPRLLRLKNVALQWRSRKDVEDNDTAYLTPQEEAAAGFVLNHGGATRGNLDKVLPWEYRLSDQSPRQGTVIELIQVRSFLHCRPAELYLGASTFREKLKYHIHWDGHVYDAKVVHHWLEELMEVTRVYLCNDAREGTS